MRIGQRIGDMKVGDSGFTLPWALDVIQTRKGLEGWIRSDYPLTGTIQGTSRMRVERHKDGWHVWPPEDETYYPSTPSHLHDIPVKMHDTADYADPWAKPKVTPTRRLPRR